MNAVLEVATRPELAGDRRWYCLRTRTKRETFAARQLRDRTGLEVFSPRLVLERRSARGGTFSEPLFPGYLFACLDLATEGRLAASTPDILGLVQFGLHVPEVDPEVIRYLRDQTASPFAAEPTLAVGDWVEVLTGAFMGQTGRIIAFDQQKERASLLLSLLGGEVRVQLPLGNLRNPGRDYHFPPALLATGS